MLNFLNTYRSFLFGLLIFSYVFSVFHKPLFEVLHFMCHVPSILLSQSKIHSFNSHSKELHAHENLSIFYTATNENGDCPQTNNKQEVKKKVELNDKYLSIFSSGILHAKHQFQINLPFQFIFIKIPDPPPQLS